MRADRWLIDLPTRFHLWCAEYELRHADGQVPGFEGARRDTLDRLREYRRARRFPRNVRSRHATPVFVDPDGRRCAVAHLMMETGAAVPARHIAATANHARIGEMDPVALTAWAARSGLTKRELARIQPNYCFASDGCGPSPWWNVVEVILFALIPLGIVSVVANVWQVVRSRARTWITAVGALVGPALVILSLLVTWEDATQEPYSDDLITVEGTGLAFCLGFLCLVASLWGLWRARTPPRPR